MVTLGRSAHQAAWSSNKTVGYALEVWHKLSRTKLPDSNGSKMCRDCLMSLERIQSSTQFQRIQL